MEETQETVPMEATAEAVAALAMAELAGMEAPMAAVAEASEPRTARTAETGEPMAAEAEAAAHPMYIMEVRAANLAEMAGCMTALMRQAMEQFKVLECYCRYWNCITSLLKKEPGAHRELKTAAAEAADFLELEVMEAQMPTATRTKAAAVAEECSGTEETVLCLAAAEAADFLEMEDMGIAHLAMVAAVAAAEED